MKGICFLIFIFILSFAYSSKAQYEVPMDNYSISIGVDSLFEVFVPPVIPDILDSEEFEYSCFYFTLVIHVDTNRRVSNIHIFPLPKVENRLEKDNVLWEVLTNNILEASKKWVFKPILFKIREDYAPDAVKYYTKVNSGKTRAILRPNTGRQSHVIIFSIRSKKAEPMRIDLLYNLNIW